MNENAVLFFDKNTENGHNGQIPKNQDCQK